nr:hypothetical protein [Tanacetum cinerariifolium]
MYENGTDNENERRYRADRELKEDMIFVIPNVEDNGEVLHTVMVEKVACFVNPFDALNTIEEGDELGSNGGSSNSERKRVDHYKKKADIIRSLQNELASPEIKVSLDANEDIGIDEVNIAIDGIFDIGESNAESMKVRNKFGEFSKNKKSVKMVVVGGGEELGVDEDVSNKVSVLKDVGGEFDDCLDEIKLGLSEEFVIRVL